MARMPCPVSVLALSLALSAPQPSAPQAAAPRQTPPGSPSPQMTWDEPPPGSPEDRALFSSAWKAQKEAIAEHSWAYRMLSDLRTFEYADRLYELAKSGTGDRAAAAERLRERLGVAAKDVYRLAAQPPLDLTHGCRPFLEGLQDAMAPASPGRDSLPHWRNGATECRERLVAWTGPLARANRAMEPLMAEAEKLLPPPAAATLAPGAAPGAPAPPRKD